MIRMFKRERKRSARETSLDPAVAALKRHFASLNVANLIAANPGLPGTCRW
jgi:hypothetical protein